MGLNSPFQQKAQLSLGDHCGNEVAIQMLLASRRAGKYHKSYTLFDTIRHLRSSYSNFVRVSNQANKKTIAFGDFNGNYSRLVEDECGSFFFKDFGGIKNLGGPGLVSQYGIYNRFIFETHKGDR